MAISPPRPGAVRSALLGISVFLFMIIYLSGPNLVHNAATHHTQSKRNAFNYINDNIDIKSNAKEHRDTGNRDIHHTERYPHHFHLRGATFNESGTARVFSSPMKSTLLHSFSPDLERSAASRMVDPARDQVYFANSPAITWYNGKLYLVARIWLDRERYEAKNNWPANHFADNFLYTQVFDRELRPITNGSMMGIPMPKQWWVGDGPIEPRMYSAFGKLYVTFNGAVAFRKHFPMDFTIIWDYFDNRPIIPDIVGGSPMLRVKEKDSMPRDKHWMSFILKDKLYFVQNIDPLRVMNCDVNAKCEFVHHDVSADGLIFHSKRNHLRGGTPFELYEWPYYIGVAHSTLYKRYNRHRYYSANLVVLSVEEPFRIVYVSEPLQLNHDIFYETPMVRSRYIEDGFLFPVSLILENKDTMTIGGHINDFSSVLIRFTGMQRLMASIMNNDRNDSPHKGPPVFSIQSYIRRATMNATKIIFTGL